MDSRTMEFNVLTRYRWVLVDVVCVLTLAAPWLISTDAMCLQYALVHARFTIPLAVLLSIIARPLLTRLDCVRIIFLLTVAVTATIPWDSYLIRTGVWTYPPDGVLGPTLFGIPVEEVFFFGIQTYTTSLVYILCNKPVLHAQYLRSPDTLSVSIKQLKVIGQFFLGWLTAYGWKLIKRNDEGTYLGLILAWASPVALFTWSLTGEFILMLPWKCTLLPIVAPTLYLWYVDEDSLRSGVWTIESGTKLDRQIFGRLEIEEAVFFVATNVLIVFGLAAFDKAVAVCDAFPEKFPESADSLSASCLMRARFLSPDQYDMERIDAIKDAAKRLQGKSRSFYAASSAFPGRLRIDLTFLYSFCRLVDDLVDDEWYPGVAAECVARLRHYLKLSYSDAEQDEIDDFVEDNFPEYAYDALKYLPTEFLSPEPLYALLEGFVTDLTFETKDDWPIETEEDLEMYAKRVAGTIGELCLNLVFHHTEDTPNQEVIFTAARNMGVALQYVNIARDIRVDAQLHRVYLPTSWLKEFGLTPKKVLQYPECNQVEKLRHRLLKKAFEKYRVARPIMELIPKEARGPMIVAVESYMEIGRVLSEGGKRQLEGRATVPLWRRLSVVWKTLQQE